MEGGDGGDGGGCWSGGGIRDWLRCGVRGDGFGGEWWC